MDLAAVVVVPSQEGLPVIEEAQPIISASLADSRPLHFSRMPILGNDVLRSWIEPIRKLGVKSLWLTSRPRGERVAADLARFARQGVERFLMIRLKSYAEMDLSDFLRFHRERRNSITEARDTRGHLGVSLLDRFALCAASHSQKYSSNTTVNGQTPYQFRGYAKRILSAKERQELVGDALIGACALRPSGKQIRDHVWIGEGAELADSVRVIGPSYIGARTIVRAGATIGPFASVESDCVIDCGTTVEQSTVLPNTYLAPGVLIRGASADGGTLEDLRSGTVADLQPAGLGGRIHQSRQKTYSKIITGLFRRPRVWRFTAPSTCSPAWVQVRL